MPSSPVVAALLLGPPCVAAVALGGELSVPALVAVLVAGSGLGLLGLARRAGAGAPPAGPRGTAWLAWALASLVWELVTLASDGLPSLSDLADPVLARPVPRGAATAGWLAAGVWLVTRPSGEPQR